MMKKVVIVMIPFIAIVIVGICLWQYQKGKKMDAEAIHLKEDLTVEFGEKVKISDFIENLEGNLVEDCEVNTEQLGETQVLFEYTNRKNKRKNAEFTLKVIDTKPPQILSGNSYTLRLGDNKSLTDVLLSGDEADDNPKREIIGEYDVNQTGDYNLTYVVTDSSGNQTKKDFVLHVKEKAEEKKKPKKLDIADVLRDYKTQDTKIGIDVSKWQEEIDWQKVKQAGIEFAMIRIGYQTEYDGACEEDPCFATNIKGAKAAGIPVGVYFYSYAKNAKQATEQAHWIKEHLQDDELDLPIAFDWENWNSFNQAGMSFYTLNKVANVFLDTVQELGYQGMLYSSKFYLEQIWEPTQYVVWLAQYNRKVTYEGEYSIWQMSESGRVDGIENDVDLDVMYLKKQN